MAGSVVCVQIARLWRARGLACLRIVPCEHFPQEDPSGTAGRPGSSPPAPATHSAGADHPACRNPQAEHRCSGNWTLWLCRRLGCYRRPARRPRSRADPGGHLGAGLPKVLSTVVSRRYEGAHRTPRSSSSPAIRRPAGPGPPPRRRSPAQARSQEHSSASAASRLTALILSEVDTSKKEVYRDFYEALWTGMRHRQGPGHRRRTVEPPPRAGADFRPAPLPRPHDRPAGHPQPRPRRAPEGPAGRRRHHPAHPPGTHRRDRVRADQRRPGAAARTQRAAGLGPALRTRTVPGRRGPARMGTAGRPGRPTALPAGQVCELRVGPEFFYLGSDAGTLTVRRAGPGWRRGGHHVRRHLLQPPDRPDGRDQRRPAQHRRRRHRDRPPRPGAARRSRSQAGTFTSLETSTH